MDAAKIKSKGIKTFQVIKIKIGKIKINYAEAGQGKPMVLVHGWTNNWVGFIPIGVLLQKKYRVIIVDLPGYGDSDLLPKYNFEIQAKYLYEFIKALKLEKPILIGHSMGTYIVSKLYSLYPDLAENIILLSPMFRHNNKTARLKVTEWFFRVTKKIGWSKKMIKKIVDTHRYSYLTSKYINMYKFDKSIVDAYGIEGKRKMSVGAYMDMGIEIAKTNIDDLIPDNKIPINLIFGKYDRLTNANTAKYLLNNKGQYHFIVINDAGHLITVEKPVETVKAIENLIN